MISRKKFPSSGNASCFVSTERGHGRLPSPRSVHRPMPSCGFANIVAGIHPRDGQPPRRLARTSTPRTKRLISRVLDAGRRTRLRQSSPASKKVRYPRGSVHPTALESQSFARVILRSGCLSLLECVQCPSWRDRRCNLSCTARSFRLGDDPAGKSAAAIRFNLVSSRS